MLFSNKFGKNKLKNTKRKVIILYIPILFIHLIHIIEEILGKAYFIESIYKGVGIFLTINLVLLIVSIGLFYFVIIRKPIAYYLSLLYVFIMILDGLDHIINNYPGLYTGIGFVIIGIPLIYHLNKEGKENRKK